MERVDEPLSMTHIFHHLGLPLFKSVIPVRLFLNKEHPGLFSLKGRAKEGLDTREKSLSESALMKSTVYGKSYFNRRSAVL